MQPGTYGPSEPVPPPPMMTAPAKKFNGKIIGGLVLVLVALIMAGIAMVSPWWSFTSTTPLGNVGMDFKLNEWCVNALGVGACGGSYGATTFMGSAFDLTKVGSTMSLGFMLTVLGLVMAILTLILILVGAGKPKLKIGVLLCGIIGAIVLLVAALYVFTSLPGAVDSAFGGTGTYSGFFGSVSAGGVSASWGGGTGWYMALVGFVLLLVGSLMAMMGMKKAP